MAGHLVSPPLEGTAPRLWTIGHSTRTEDEFLDLLAEYEIEALADVRRHPGSRRMPQFGGAALEASLRSRGMDYLWLPGLGGRRKAAPDSPNTAWRSSSFRGYADYLFTEPFAESLTELLNLAAGLTPLHLEYRRPERAERLLEVDWDAAFIRAEKVSRSSSVRMRCICMP